MMTANPSIGGESRSVLIVDNCLHAMGAGARSIGEDLAVWLGRAGWRVITTSGRKSRALRLIDMTTTAWERRQNYASAIVNVFSGAAFRWAEASCWVLRRCGKPYLLALHGGSLPDFCRSHAHRARSLLASAAGVYAPSGYLKAGLSDYCKNIRVLPNGIDLEQFEYTHRPTIRPNMVWVRAFHSIYNPDLAVRVLHLIKQRHSDATLTMIGRDKQDGSLDSVRQLSRELGVASDVNVVGAVNKADIPKWLSRTDILLNTTNVDNTPLSVLEAMACGLCVVTTRVGGIPYLLEHDSDALLVPPNDAAAMARSVERLLTEPGLAARLSMRGQEKAQQFDWSKVIPQWESALCASPGIA